MLFLFSSIRMQMMQQSVFPIARDMKKVCKGRTGKACTACEQLCSNLHDVTDASGTESESSDLLDDVIVLDHKPSNWIDSSPGKSKKRRREEDSDDEVIILDDKPADWIDRQKRRHQD
ncbi:uncharacterized protein F5147DRAFT_649845 [Suillus discolor]|uniref:Uncharacterized protein n=1 Tax=Suillus discolor TaxID=1912936 RepID=A0A9P7FD85_9AGAM|nr:uncharacterized protein F5147DRAFT_649845 [Suillus discolor]KAG2114682.1 hypothetical protein F5147DRAFT_649845 [Suillus discolor]